MAGMENARDPRRFTALNGLALAAAVIFALFPLFWLLVSSFKPWWELAHVPAIWITDQPTLRNYHRVFYPYEDPLGIFQPSSWRAMISSIVISAVATFLSVSLGLMAAIAIARYRTGGNFLPLQILSYRMVPPITLAIPFGVLGVVFGVTSTPVLLTLIYTVYTLPLSTWMLKSFIEQVPVEIEEAALMDGMSRWWMHLYVTIPAIRGGLAATVLFILIVNFSEGAIAMALAAGNWVTIPVQIAAKAGSPHVQVAIGTLAAAPLIVCGLLIHRHMGRGFTFGAIRS